MIDIKFLRENPEAVKENIKKKFQDNKLELVESRRPSGLRKTISSHNSLAHRTTWLRSDF